MLSRLCLGEADAVRRLTKMRKTASDFAKSYKGAEARSEARAEEAEKKVEHFKEELKEEETLLNSARKATAAATDTASKSAAAAVAAAKAALHPKPEPKKASGFGKRGSDEHPAPPDPAPAAAVPATEPATEPIRAATKTILAKASKASLLARQPPLESPVAEADLDALPDDETDEGEVDDLVAMDP